MYAQSEWYLEDSQYFSNAIFKKRVQLKTRRKLNDQLQEDLYESFSLSKSSTEIQ